MQHIGPSLRYFWTIIQNPVGLCKHDPHKGQGKSPAGVVEIDGIPAQSSSCSRADSPYTGMPLSASSAAVTPSAAVSVPVNVPS